MTFNPNAPLDPSQVEDRRGTRIGGPAIAAGGGGMTILLLIVSMLFGVNPFDTQSPVDTSGQRGTQPGGSEQTTQECRTGADANQRADCRVVGMVNSIQDHWSDEFARRGQQYQQAQTVLFSGAVQAGCGYATEAQGPFYCPSDQKIYLDLTFFQDLQQRFGAEGGPFAEGYVIAHEYGHHIQNLAGALTNREQSQSAAIGIELTADCLAGVWANHASATGYLQPPTDDDIAEALDAAGAVGDDRIQGRLQGRVTPETWTHGSAQQRQQAFATGYKSGSLDACNLGG